MKLDLEMGLLILLATFIILVCLFSYNDILSVLDFNKLNLLENMNTEEIITDFESIMMNNITPNNTPNNTPNDKNDKDLVEGFIPLANTEFQNYSKGWDLYTQSPYYEWKTHPRKAVFYEKPLYRKPYRYPFKYISSYPIPHLAPFKN